MVNLELYDCTLREGEQAAGASFDLAGRVELFSQLDDFGFDFIEVGWPFVSEKIKQSFELCRKIRKTAKIVAFGSTSINSDPSIDENLKSLLDSKADCACIFGKSHLDHVKKQLNISPEDNLRRIEESILFLKKNGMTVFYDAEHFFDAFKDHKEYAIKTLISAIKGGAERIILCDTNGGIMPSEAESIIKETYEELKNYNVKFGVHFHNDCNLALANVLVCLHYIVQVQGTINGTGERVGNLNFSEFIPIYTVKLGNKLNVKSKNLKILNELAYRMAGSEIPESRAFVGETSFAHKGGVHIDAMNKGASYEHIDPETFGNHSIFLLNTMGGRTSVIEIAKMFGHELDKKDSLVKLKIEKLFKELGELERKGYKIGFVKAEHYLLIEKYFGELMDFFTIHNDWDVRTWKEGGKEYSECYMNCSLDGVEVERKIKVEGGPVDAIYKTLISIVSEKYPIIHKLELVDFHVGIARRHGEESSVRTAITFECGEKFETVGVDGNIIQSTIEAIEKGFRYYLNLQRKSYLNA